jgi:LmbE family N-acetylglucosaminyl deacetylase
MTRVVVVLGYSDGGVGELHTVCAERLARAAEVSTEDDVVVLSGWARVPHTPSEAGLMRAAWRGAGKRVHVDEDARTTAENAANAVRHILEEHANEVLIVTSVWHAARARVAFRWLLRGTGVRVAVVTASEKSHNRRARVRELAVWPLLPAQLAAVGRAGRVSLRGRSSE